MGDLLESALHVLAPRMCAQCQTDLPPPLRGPLCGACLLLLRPLRERLCLRCGTPDEGPEEHCRRCRERVFAVDCIRAAFPYRPPVRRLLHQFKYRGLAWPGRCLADWMAGVYGRLKELHGADCIIPVPLHPSRLRERGFDQAEILARAVARAAKRPFLKALLRRRSTQPQWRLGRAQRAENLRDAFAPAPGVDVRGRSVLLVDDVCTSGGTLEGCGRALQAAGAAAIRAFVLARDL